MSGWIVTGKKAGSKKTGKTVLSDKGNPRQLFVVLLTLLISSGIFLYLGITIFQSPLPGTRSTGNPEFMPASSGQGVKKQNNKVMVNRPWRPGPNLKEIPGREKYERDQLKWNINARYIEIYTLRGIKNISFTMDHRHKKDVKKDTPDKIKDGPVNRDEKKDDTPRKEGRVKDASRGVKKDNPGKQNDGPGPGNRNDKPGKQNDGPDSGNRNDRPGPGKDMDDRKPAAIIDNGVPLGKIPVTIKCNVNADVFICNGDGQESRFFGKTVPYRGSEGPCNCRLVARLKPGQYQVELKHKNFRTASRQVYISPQVDKFEIYFHIGSGEKANKEDSD